MMLNLWVIGRTNVGKSTLVNGLLGFQRSIVYDQPGTTLDIVADTCDWGRGMIRVCDTQGIFSNADLQWVEEQLEAAGAGENAIVFVVDAQSGITPFDENIALLIRRQKLPVILVVNKCDVKNAESETVFSEWGFKSIETSAVHKRNLDPLREWVLSIQQSRHKSQFTKELISMFTSAKREKRARRGERAKSPQGVSGAIPRGLLASSTKHGEAYRALRREDTYELLSKPGIRLAIVGRPNTGKSTLINRLSRAQVSRVSPIALTTRDPVISDLSIGGNWIRIIDTAGMRRPRSRMEDVESLSVRSTTETIDRADVVFLMVDCREGITDQDLRVLSLINRRQKPAAVLYNFWDCLSRPAQQAFLDNIAPIIHDFETVSISAKSGYHLNQLLPLAIKLYGQGGDRIPTSEFNAVIRTIIDKNPPPSRGRGNFNILYAIQATVRPPTFVFFMNRKDHFPKSYQRYLENELKDAFGYRGTPIRLLFRAKNEQSAHH